MSDSRSVYFSQGNLEFNAVEGSHDVYEGISKVKGTWRFASEQWSTRDNEENESISKDYDGWIGLFGWGTSGWNSCGDAYQPWDTTRISLSYQPGNNEGNNLTCSNAKADWGVYNAISNGGNKPNQWRTLTAIEWDYLKKHNKWTWGNVKMSSYGNTYKCFMLLPEDFVAPDGINITISHLGDSDTTAVDSFNYSVPESNNYFVEEFHELEKLGVVALPCACTRWVTTVDGIPSSAHLYSYEGIDYWSSTGYRQASQADVLLAYSFMGDHLNRQSRSLGCAVRLVQDVPTLDRKDHIKDGALIKATYKVSDSLSVYFSQGNLEFKNQGTHKTAEDTSQGIWRFAEKQYYTSGTGCDSLSPGWSSYFSWGTSGHKREPWNRGVSDNSLYSEGKYYLDDSEYADWGVYNAISNGGNEPGMWRTLTGSEWAYLLENNSWVLGEVEGKTCVMLIPEKFSAPEGIIVSDEKSSVNGNIYTADQFKKIEKLGVVALPRGEYWSSSVKESTYPSQDKHTKHVYEAIIYSIYHKGCGYDYLYDTNFWTYGSICRMESASSPINKGGVACSKLSEQKLSFKKRQ